MSHAPSNAKTQIVQSMEKIERALYLYDIEDWNKRFIEQRYTRK